jgi:hypothetical protein
MCVCQTLICRKPSVTYTNYAFVGPDNVSIWSAGTGIEPMAVRMRASSRRLLSRNSEKTTEHRETRPRWIFPILAIVYSLRRHICQISAIEQVNRFLALAATTKHQLPIGLVHPSAGLRLVVGWSAGVPHTLVQLPSKTLKAKKWVNTIYDLIWPCFQPTAGRPNQRPTTSIGHKSDALRCDMVQGMGSEMQDRLWCPHISMGSAKTARTGGLKSARRSLTCVGRQSCVTVSRRSGKGMPLAQDPPPCTIELPCVRPSGRHHFHLWRKV